MRQFGDSGRGWAGHVMTSRTACVPTLKLSGVGTSQRSTLPQGSSNPRARNGKWTAQPRRRLGRLEPGIRTLGRPSRGVDLIEVAATIPRVATAAARRIQVLFISFLLH